MVNEPTDVGAATQPPHSPASEPPMPLEPVNFARPGALVAILGALWLAMNEISVLSGQFLTAQGEHSSFGELGGSAPWKYRSHWRDVLESAPLGDWKQLLGLYLFLDIVFIAVYAVALLALVRAITRRKRHWVSGLVWALVIVDVVEDLLWLVAGVVVRQSDRQVPGWLTYAVTLATALKWAAVGLLALAALFAGLVSWRVVVGRGSEVVRAVFIQRFSLLAFLPIAVLAVVPLGHLNNLFDQLPDVERAWLDSGTGLWHMVFAGAVFLWMVLPAIFILGRFRADWAYRRVVDKNWPYFDQPSEPGAEHGASRTEVVWFWLVGPILVGVLALLVSNVWDGAIFKMRLVIFCAIPVAIVLISWVMRSHGYQRLPALPKRDLTYAKDVMAAGDILTFAALSLTGFGLIRAFTGESALWALGMLDLDVTARPWRWPALALLAGFGVAIVPWLISFAMLRAIAERANTALPVPAPLVGLAVKVGMIDQNKRAMGILRPGRNVYEPDDGNSLKPVDSRELTQSGILALLIVVFVWLVADPRGFAYTYFWVGLGVLGAATLAMAVLILMLGVAMSYAQRRQPPELIQWMRVVPRPQWVWHKVTRKPWPATRRKEGLSGDGAQPR